MENWPEYACAILLDSEERFLLESRPDTARLAPGQLTCFGGRREAGETPEQCLRRELHEELSWEPQTVTKQVELWVGGKLIAWFYLAELDVPVSQLHVHSNHQALLVARSELPGLLISPWHAATLNAFLEGRTIVQLDETCLNGGYSCE